MLASPAGSGLTGSVSYWDTHSLSAASVTTVYHCDSTALATCSDSSQTVNNWVSTADPCEPEPHQSELSLPSPASLTQRRASPTVVMSSRRRGKPSITTTTCALYLCLSQVSIVKPITPSTTKTQHPQHIISSALRPVTLSLTGLRRIAALGRSSESRDGARESSHDKTLIVFVSILGLDFGLWYGPKFYRFLNLIWVMGLITILASLHAFVQNFFESIDGWLRSLPVTTCCLRHGNVEVCGSYSNLPSTTSPDSTLPSDSLRQLPPTKSTIQIDSLSNSPMVSEKKIVSTVLTSCLSTVLFTGSIEIHLVSRVNIVDSRADLIRLMGFFLMRLCMELTLEFSLGFLSVNSTLVRAISGNFQSKEIFGIVKGIRLISSGFAAISFYHVSRSNNLVVDALAKRLFKPISLCNGHHDLSHRFGLISSS